MEITNAEEGSTPEVTAADENTQETEAGTSDQSQKDVQLRNGTISSARFNILCTMVGGGCLSLPMAFQKTGNGLLGPSMLALTAVLTDACFRMIISTTRRLSPVSPQDTAVGTESYERLAAAAFGARGYLFTKWLVTLISVSYTHLTLPTICSV